MEGYNNLHKSILYSFLLTGHTKFGPDRCFGMLKKAVQVTYVSSIYEMANIVETSSTAGVNKVQLVGTHDGRSIVPVYDWATYLGQYFKKSAHIKKYHHFRFSEEEPGMIYYKEWITSPEKKVNLLKDKSVLPSAELPLVIEPQGLDKERKNYLFNEIRQFCKSGTEDLVAPHPDTI